MFSNKSVKIFIDMISKVYYDTLMKNGIVKISIFRDLDEIRNKHNISDGVWAEMSFGEQAQQSRISELRHGAENRPFSYQKCVKLVNGLKKILGDDIMSQEVRKMIEKTDDLDEKLHLYLMALPEPEKITAEIFLRQLLKTKLKLKDE